MIKCNSLQKYDFSEAGAGAEVYAETGTSLCTSSDQTSKAARISPLSEITCCHLPKTASSTTPLIVTPSTSLTHPRICLVMTGSNRLHRDAGEDTLRSRDRKLWGVWVRLSSSDHVPVHNQRGAAGSSQNPLFSFLLSHLGC